MSTARKSPTLSTAPLEHIALDYAALRRAGIRHLERMAGHLWTDFNAHDPGITILEQLCYALTDLAYRASHELPDLLSEPGPDPYPHLFTPARILGCEPVTLLDLRKLVVDVDGVKNAWVEAVADPLPALYYHEGRRELSLVADDDTAEQVQLKGLYRVLIEKSELSRQGGAVVQREVTRRLHAHRNLCEDFAEVVVLDPHEARVHAHVEIDPVADAETLLLTIYQVIDEYMSPTIQFRTLRDALADGRRVDEIFDGPRLDHGFVDSEALTRLERRRTLHTSDLIQAIMATPGVRAVRGITLSAADGPHEPWTLTIAGDRVARLALTDVDAVTGRPALTITLVREQLAVAVDEDEVVRRFNAWLASRDKGPPLGPDDLDLVPARGEDRELALHRSIQREFPATYGIGDIGRSDSASPERKAEATQLRAYLTFFDHILANCMTQLAHARRLFAFDALGTRSYFTQAFDDPILARPEVWRDGAAPTEDELAQMTAAAVPAGSEAERRGRFLDHLLARFGEALTDYSLVLFGAMRSAEGSTRQDAVRERLARDKEAFLREYPTISGARGRAFDLQAPAGPTNTAGLAERIRLKLGLVAEHGEEFHLVEHILLRPIDDDRNQVSDDASLRVPLLAEARYKDPYSLQLSVVFADWPPRLRHPAFRRFVEQTVREETPAHLTVYVHWVDRDRWDGFGAAHRRWLDLRRESFAV
jgi:hypothetical protein